MNRMNFWKSFWLLGVSALPLAAQPDTTSAIFSLNMKPDEIRNRASREAKQVMIFLSEQDSRESREMLQFTFRDSAVADFLNHNFICAAYPADGISGNELKKKYQTEGTPVCIFLSPDGTLLHLLAGFKSELYLQEDLKRAIDPDRNLKALEKKYRKKPSSFEAAFEYFSLLKSCRENQLNSELNKWFASRSTRDRDNQQSWQMLYEFVTDPNCPAFQHFQNSIEAYASKFSKDSVRMKLEEVFLGDLRASSSYNRNYASWRADSAWLMFYGFKDAPMKIAASEISLAGDDFRRGSQKVVRYLTRFQPYSRSEVSDFSRKVYLNSLKEDSREISELWLAQASGVLYTDYWIFLIRAGLLKTEGKMEEAKVLLSDAIFENEEVLGTYATEAHTLLDEMERMVKSKEGVD